MTDVDYERELGRINTDLKYLKKDQEEIKATVKEMRDLLIGAKGSWKVVVIVGGLIATLVLTGIGSVIKHITVNWS